MLSTKQKEPRVLAGRWDCFAAGHRASLSCDCSAYPTQSCLKGQKMCRGMCFELLWSSSWASKIFSARK